MLAGFSRITSPRAAKLNAVLKGVAGFTGVGAIRYLDWPGGRRRIEADLAGVAGLKVEVVVKSIPVGALACREGAVAGRLDTNQSAPIPPLVHDDLIEIRQNGSAILRGRLERA